MQRTASWTAAELYRGWNDYQEKLVTAIAPLDDAQLNLSAAPQLWSVRMLASHVIATRAWWFHFFLGEGGSEFERYAHSWLDEAGTERYASWDDFEETASLEAVSRRSAAELVQGLEETGSLLASCLQRWTVADLDAEVERPFPNEAGETSVRTRQWVVWHIAEHDLHHGGEISLTLGMHGLAGLNL
ncbi:MAG: DinB family protein [Candidatus Dormibacteraeota bacterium]|nr:DinB family protein [Candidatus Dormibacteraeota bacterium]